MPKEISNIYNEIIYLYQKGEVSEVNIVYTDFISPVKQEVKSLKVLPIGETSNSKRLYIIEPNEEEVLKSSIEIYLKSQLRRCMLSAKASEQSSRMTAMDGANRKCK